MQWDEFYEKARYDWSSSTTTSRLSKLESLGSPEEVADLVEYYMDDAGMVRLINRAISADMVFSGEQITNMATCLDEKHADTLVSYALKKDVHFTADQIIELAADVSMPVMNRVAAQIDFPLTEDLIDELDGSIDEDLLQELRIKMMPAAKGDGTERPEVLLTPDEQQYTHTEGARSVTDEGGKIQKPSLLHRLFPKKYRYVLVLFQSADHAYSYRTEDRSIKQGDIVMVPVAGKDPQPAYVSEVRIVTEENAPYPLARTKMVLGKADRKTRKAFVLNDNRIPMDISRYRVNTPDGVVEITTTEVERKILREKYKNHPRVKIIETRKPAQPEDARDWIDEMEAADALFDDPELGAYTSVLKDTRRKQVKQAAEKARKKKNKDDFWRGAGETMFIDDTIDSLFGKKKK